MTIKQKTAHTIPAAPGWRAVLTNKHEALLIDVVAWTIDVHHVVDEELHDGDQWVDARGKALVVDEQGKGLCMPEDITHCIPGDWHYFGLLSPGQQLQADQLPGWQKVPWPQDIPVETV